MGRTGTDSAEALAGTRFRPGQAVHGRHAVVSGHVSRRRSCAGGRKTSLATKRRSVRYTGAMKGLFWTLTLSLIAAACHESPQGPPGRGGDGDVKTSADPHRSQYVSLVGGRHRAGARVAEAENLRIGGWRFFQEVHEPPGGRMTVSGRAAVDGRGHAVSPRLVGHGAWYQLLAADGLDAAGALDRVAWLFDAAPVTATGEHAMVEDPAVRALIADPLLERTEKGVRFVGCLARPPTFEPWRTTIDAPATGPAKVLEEMLRAQ